MNTVGIIFSAEFVRRIKSRAFLAGTLIGAASILLIAILPSILGGAMSSSSKKIVLVGEPALTSTARSLLQRDFEITATLTRLDGAPTPAFLDAHGKASAVAILTRPPGDGLRAVAYARDPSAFRESFARDLAPLQIALATGVPVGRIAAHVNVSVDVHDVSGRFADASSADAAKGVAYLFIMMLYLSILLNAQSIMTSVAEEKTSRIAELLVATISPMNLLSGKTIAVAATTLLQVAFWAAAALALFPRASTALSMSSGGGADSLAQGPIDPGLLVAFVAFFILGFLQYSTIYAAAASLISRTEDLGSVSGPIILPALLAFFLAQYALVAPEAPAVVAFSFVPFVSPLLMFTRVAVANVPAWQLSLAFAIDIVAVVLCFVVAGRVYRIGMLLSGNLPSPAQIWAAIRT